eukprot:1047705-Prorocentrum_minimum.AAC.1
MTDVNKGYQGIQYVMGVHGLPSDCRLPTAGPSLVDRGSREGISLTVYSHGGPIRRMKCGYILRAGQSDLVALLLELRLEAVHARLLEKGQRRCLPLPGRLKHSRDTKRTPQGGQVGGLGRANAPFIGPHLEPLFEPL